MSQCQGYANAVCGSPPAGGTLPFTGFEVWLMIGLAVAIFAVAAIAASARR